MIDNLPCPSCGNAAVEEFIPLPDKYPEYHAIICRKCGMRGPTAAWNVRHPPVVVKGPIAFDVYDVPPRPDAELAEAREAIVKLRDGIRGLLMVSLPRDISGEQHVHNARKAMHETESLDSRIPKQPIDSNATK